MAQTSNEILNKMLFNSYVGPRNLHQLVNSPNEPWAYCVHASVLENVLHTFFLNAECEIFEYELQIGEKCYDMRIIIVPSIAIDKSFLLITSIKNSQFSFPWENIPNLFINRGSFNILQQFIRNQNLEDAILKIHEQPGITANDEIIKVVTFNQSVNALDICEKYQIHLSSAATYYQPPNYYYMTHAFPWLQPYWLTYFKIPINSEFYPVFFIILNHLGRLNYTNNLNIMDLLMLRLALCDYRDPFESSLVKYEIDFMIRRELAKLVKNSNHLDIDQYLITKNCEQRELLIVYLVHEFQNHFETIGTANQLIIPELEASKVHDTIQLATESDILNRLKDKSNVWFTIDGRSFDKMSLSLFLDLVECHNVISIMLHTNYTWLNDDVCELNRNIVNSLGRVNVCLFGENCNNFIEDFVSSLKLITFSKGQISLSILHTKLNDYTIFDNLSVEEVGFYSVNIDTHMLEGLNKCKLKSLIRIWNGTFENTRHNWRLLYNLKRLDFADIVEDEDSWQSLFEFVLDELLKSNSKEFQFDVKNFAFISGIKRVSVDQIKFTVNELNSKLEICNRINNQIVDLYDLKFTLEPDEKSDYEFYQ